LIGTGLGIYYKKQGYTFYKVFVGAFLSATALGLLFYTMLTK
ncbi:MAG: hypothetical protein ACI9J3_003124, partial [Parvicellaceae bacterium]